MERNRLMKITGIKNFLFRILVSVALSLITLDGFSIRYEIETFQVVFRDVSRGNRKVPVDIFYPVAKTGNEKFPVICFGHGYLISGKWYSHIVDILVPEGYIVIFPDVGTGMFPSHKKYALDLGFAMNEISSLDKDSSSPLFNRMSGLKCLMGHSMGGGAATVAASLGNEADAIITLAPFETRTSAIKAASAVKIPMLIFAGTNDCITPPDKNQIPIYDNAASRYKTLITIRGGTHCQMGVSHPKCSSGEKVAGCRDVNITYDEQLKILSRYLLPWLRFYLNEDAEAGKRFDSELKNDKSIEYMQSSPVSSK